jgi:c(7)-type cytochrome triheme protein
VLDQDILLNLKGGTPIVRFPHLQHTLWLDCSNCHDKIFKQQTGATKISMQKILQGEQCGVCHGAVAFPLTECTRCHSVPRITSVINQPKPVSPPAAAGQKR